MLIICFEGASAVGKTALSEYLRANFDAYVVPEVNLLFERKESEPRFWYLKKQIERWKLASCAVANHKIVILDGDPFQPIWYNWAYDFDFGEPLETITDFYKKKLAAGEIRFPDKYFILSVKTAELQKRKALDDSRTRKNFDRHLRFIEPQRAFFNFIKSINNDLVDFIENREIEESGKIVIDLISNQNASPNAYSSPALFDEVREWLKNNNAEKFKSY